MQYLAGMKNLYTIAFCLFATLAFGQDTTKTIKNHGFWVAASYGYNTRSFMPDFYQPINDPAGTFSPKAYLAGHMPQLEVGYSFNGRLGLYAAFTLPLALKHEYDNGLHSGYDQAKGWYASLGGQFHVLNKFTKIRPYIKASFNGGMVSIHHKYGNTNYEYRGGYMLGGSIVLGTDIKLCKRFYALAEVNFTQMVYQPKELYNVNTGQAKPYSTDLSDGFDPNYGWVYTSSNSLPEHFNMNFISFRAGLRYNLFGE